jgi:hypothetical protein
VLLENDFKPMKVNKIMNIMGDKTHPLHDKLKDIEMVWNELEDDEELIESIKIFAKHKKFK